MRIFLRFYDKNEARRKRIKYIFKTNYSIGLLDCTDNNDDGDLFRLVSWKSNEDDAKNLCEHLADHFGYEIFTHE